SSRPDAVSAAEAPTACRPATTRAKELAKPVTAPTIPAPIGWRSDARTTCEPRGSGDRSDQATARAVASAPHDVPVISRRGFAAPQSPRELRPPPLDHLAS